MYALFKCAVILSAALAVSTLQADDLVFHLFTRANPTVSQPLAANVQSILTSIFSLERPTIFTIHNHGETVATNFNAFVVPALLMNSDANVIAVDWSEGSPIYTLGLVNTPVAGNAVASFINLLVNDLGYNTNRVTIVGLGLGAHVAGVAGRRVNGNIAHIVGLDPSLHGWTHHPDRLSSNAATLVEVAHATAGLQGYDRPLGHLDFYPNGGTYQNGCGLDVTCSYSFVYVFFAESLTSEIFNGPKFRGTACESYEQALLLQCSGERDAVFGGLAAKPGSSGVYTFETNLAQPFARD